MAAALLGRDAELAELGEGRRARAPRHGHAAAPLGRGRRRQDAPRRRGRRRLGRARAARRGELQRRLPLRPCRRRAARVPARRPARFAGLGALRAHLALLLPELGEQAPAGDRATIFEAIRAALAEIGGARARRARRPAVVRRGDARAARRARADARRAAAVLVSAPTAPTACRATTSCAGCATSCAAAAGCTSWRWRRSTSARPPSCSRACCPSGPRPPLAVRDPRPHAGPAVLRRGAGPRARGERRASRPARAGSTSAATRTCRRPTPSATRC